MSMPEGYKPWNKGLTKETSTLVASIMADPERSRKLSEAKKGKAPPICGWNKGVTAWNKGLTKATSEKVARYAKPRSVPRRQEWSDAISDAKKGQPCSIAGWNRGLTKETSESIAKVSRAAHSRMLDPVYAHNLFASLNLKPNKPEKAMLSILDRLYPNEWKYVGDGQVILGGKCPDFINVNGHKQIIEVYGEYWHRNDDPQERIDEFSEFGYKTLIVWVNELKNETALAHRIKSFLSIETLQSVSPSTG